jgi:septum formation protein
MLRRLGLAFTVRPADLDESARDGESPADLVARLAREKAAAVARSGEIVLGADTLVVLDGEILGKPADDADAARMLAALSGREHEVVTGVALVEADTGRVATGVERTLVTFAPLSQREIDWYVASGEPGDKAGAYGIHGLGGLFVTAIAGNYPSVVGLPLPLVYRLAGSLGFDLLAACGQGGPVLADPARDGGAPTDRVAAEPGR